MVFSREFQTVGAHTRKAREPKFRSMNSRKIGRGGTKKPGWNMWYQEIG